MKRTLVEVFCGLAALVLMVSYHHQIARLEEHQQDLTVLERKVDKASANARDLDQMRQEILAQTEGRMKALEAQLAVAREGSDRAKTIAEELHRAKTEVASLRTQVSSDFER